MINSEFINGLESGYYIKRNMGTSTFIKDKFYEVYENDGVFYVDDEKGNQVVLSPGKEYWEHEYYKKYELLYVKVNDEISQLKKVNENAVKKIKELKNELKIYKEYEDEEIDNLKTEIEKLTEANKKLKIDYTCNINENEQLKTSVKNLQNENKKLWDENKGLEKDNNQLSSDNTEFRLILKKVNNDCSQLEEKIKNIEMDNLCLRSYHKNALEKIEYLETNGINVSELSKEEKEKKIQDLKKRLELIRYIADN